MKAFKITEIGSEHTDRLIVTHPSWGYVLCATPVEPTIRGYGSHTVSQPGSVTEVDMKDEKWAHPHLLKVIRQELLKLNKKNSHCEAGFGSPTVTLLR